LQPAVIGALGIVALFTLILLQVPIGFAMMTVGVVGFALAGGGWMPAFSFLGQEPSYVLSSTDLAAVPLFLLMGVFASMAGFSEDVYRAAAAFLGHRRGGLAYATITGSAAFGAICGSSTATAATFGKVALPQMLDRGYSPAFSAGVIAAGGTLKSLIPPSLVMIIYCVVAKTFILDMFVAAIVPALITIAFNLIAIAIVVRRRPLIAPVSVRMAWSERLEALRRAGPSLALLLGVFIGIYSGVFTVNEAASAAAILALLFALARRRMSWAGLSRGMYEAGSVTAMLYLILMAAPIFTYFINLAHVPEALIQWIDGHHFPPLGVIFTLTVVYILFGTFFEEMSSILITLPLILPIIIGLRRLHLGPCAQSKRRHSQMRLPVN
jgi:C4-dicarboxylate transporter, DctM subunit